MWGIFRTIIQREFKISKKSVKKLKIVSGAMIEGNTINLDKLPVQVCDGAKQLKYGVDYTLAVSGGIEGSPMSKGKFTVTVTAGSNSNYTGSCTAKITVYGKPSKNFKGFIVSSDDVTLEYESTGYIGKQLKPAVKEIMARDEQNNLLAAPLGRKDLPKVTVIDRGTNKTLRLGKDYTVRYANNLHASNTETNKGKAKIIITGIGAYSGISLTREFEILPLDIKKASIKGTLEKLNITHAKRALVENYDYKIADVPTPAGKKVEITLEGVGDFKGTVKKKVNP